MKEVPAGHAADHLSRLLRITNLKIDNLTADIIHTGM